MSCPLAHDDAAYVLGALSPGDRLEFERHLSGCRRCTRAVRELAGLPGLLGRVPPGVVERPDADPPVPGTLVPALARAVRRTRRRVTVATATGAAVVAGLAVPVVLSQISDSSATAPDADARGSTGARVVSHSMAPVGDVPVQARVALERVTWGTRLDLACTYRPGSRDGRPPAAMDYILFVRTRDGHSEQVGSWRPVAGRTMRLSAATASSRADIASVEVRAPDGSVLLTLSG